MIKSFNHKGLQLYFETGSRKGIQPEHAEKLARILDVLNAAIAPSDMNLPGFKLHELTGNEKNTWSVRVNGNWRVTFKFENGDAVIVDYRDYH
jgi:proteic killer suppression protein